MFYSQFILAKKGPLGTIWIAAHLERKLRKNQVADTDIGVSVDSILSPDIPIALRVSSHLLLGVVRIYSRKVNYLFHDCSETLLKVKQAFRSTVVDLPPEESTAPYHSITLPETFDLDDFVLPDAAVLNGNFVDHHVSTREQITLQDSVEGTGCSTLQFGLDERFGDGDAPQIGLDIDEEVFLEKDLADHDVTDTLGLGEKMEVQMSDLPETPFACMDLDDCQDEFNEHKIAGLPKDMSERVIDIPGKPYVLSYPHVGADFPNIHGYNIQTPDLNELIFGDAGIPSEVPHDMVASYTRYSDALHSGPVEHAEAPSTPVLVEEAIPANVQEAPLSSQGNFSPSNVAEDINPDSVHTETECHDSTTHNATIPSSTSCPEELPKKSALNSDSVLKPCTSHANQSDATPVEGPTFGENGTQTFSKEELARGTTRSIEGSSLERQGEEFSTMNDPEALHVSLDALPSDDPVDHSKPDGLPADVLHDTFGASFSASSEYPEPERMLLAPSGDHGIPDDLQHTSDKGTSRLDGRVDRSRNLSSKRRYVVEETPDLHNGSSVKVSEVPRMKRKIDHIPDDDDLLASILVGKGASGFKLKSTPSLPASPFSKKSRPLIKTGVQKRKVLQDDTMVLHADAIRQQLISTMDIRRIRKKAPCTHSEIWMIKKSFSEDETFGESILSGMSEELASLYIQNYDPNEMPISEPDSNFPHSDVSKSNLPSNSEIVSGTSYEGMNNSLTVVSAKHDALAQGSESHARILKQDCGVALSACELDVLGSERENNEPELLLEKSSLEQAVNNIEKDNFSVGIDDTSISKEYSKELENKSCVVDEPYLFSSEHSMGDKLHNLNSEAFSSFGNFLVEDGSDKQIESMNIIGDASTCVSEFPTENSNSVGPSSITNDHSVVETSQQHLGVPFDDQFAFFSCPPELCSDLRTATSSLEFSVFQVPAGQKAVEAEDVLGLPTTGDSSGFCSVTGGNVTDFLIGDDEADVDKEGNYDVPNTEVQSLENSGWSVRTRGVIRYLKLLFDDESGFGRKAVEMDRLLTGKTRKEASRMFFETLVLKTKDYLQVQQQNSYDDISIRPTTKLLKSEF